MSVIFRAAATTDVGTVRANNEDAALASPHIVAVADGMGGHAAGEVASGLVMDQLAALARQAADDGDGPDSDRVTSALRRSRDALRAMSAVDVELAGMGTTLVGLVATGGELLLVHIGDSRLYRLREGELTQLTTDHTHVQHLVNSGRLAPEAVRSHPFRSVILRSLDDTSDDLPDVETISEVAPGDRLLLCSDGLSDYVDEKLIGQALAGGSPQEASDRLVAVAIHEATRDNVTALVADVVEAASADAAVVDAAVVDAALPLAHLGVTPAEMVLTRSAREAMEATVAEADDGAGLADEDGDVSAGEGEGAGTAGETEGADEDGDDTDGGAVADAGGDLEADAGEADPEDPDADAAAGTIAPDTDTLDPAALDADDEDPTPVLTQDPLPTEGDAQEATGAVVGHSVDLDQGGAAVTARPTRREVLWISLVVVTFLATAAAVWFTS